MVARVHHKKTDISSCGSSKNPGYKMQNIKQEKVLSIPNISCIYAWPIPLPYFINSNKYKYTNIYTWVQRSKWLNWSTYRHVQFALATLNVKLSIGKVGISIQKGGKGGRKTKQTIELCTHFNSEQNEFQLSPKLCWAFSIEYVENVFPQVTRRLQWEYMSIL